MPGLLRLLVPAVAILASTASAQDKPAATKYATVKDVPYRTGDGLTDAMRERCRLDVHHPENAKNAPTVVWFEAPHEWWTVGKRCKL